jgi:integrase
MGSLYRPKLKSGEQCSIWWVKYYSGGKCIRVSTGTESKPEAQRFLKDREGRAVAGQPLLPRVDRVRYDEAAEDLRAYYRTTGRRNLVEAKKRLKHLDAFFIGSRLAAIDAPAITKYVERRQTRIPANGDEPAKDGAANGTINRELAVLSRMLRLAYENGKLVRLPVIRKLKEADPRSGFFEPHQFEAVKKYLPDDVKLAVTIAYTYGWRMQSEVLALERRHVDLTPRPTAPLGTVTLDPGMTKNGRGRVVYMTPELNVLLGAQLARIKALERELGRVIPWLFPYFKEPHISPRLVGTQRADFRKAWLTACNQAGVPGKLRHDFRRTAARNMVRAGVPERVAMTITGHLTRSVFDRYNIVSEGDLRTAAERIAAQS